MKDEGEGAEEAGNASGCDASLTLVKRRGRRKEVGQGESPTAAVTGKFWPGRRGIPEPVTRWRSPLPGRNGPALVLLLGSAIGRSSFFRPDIVLVFLTLKMQPLYLWQRLHS